MIAALLTMFAIAQGIPAKAVPSSDLVIVEGRPGCRVVALHNDASRPVVVCR